MALSFASIEQAAQSLLLEPCMIKAVVDVESSGSGFLSDGRVKILFEGHVFWKQLKSRGIDPAELAKDPSNTGILYPKWTKKHYRGGSGEWERLELARAINNEAALCSASWGLFQIMGYHYQICGYNNVIDFVAGQANSEEEQLLSFCNFMRSQNLDGFLAKKDWAGFAERYNGKGYKANNYDTRLASAYAECLG